MGRRMDIGVRHRHPVQVQALHRHCREHLAPQKTPAVWCRVDEFPLTGSRKIQKFKLRDRYLAGDYGGEG